MNETLLAFGAKRVRASVSSTCAFVSEPATLYALTASNRPRPATEKGTIARLRQNPAFMAAHLMSMPATRTRSSGQTSSPPPAKSRSRPPAIRSRGPSRHTPCRRWPLSLPSAPAGRKPRPPPAICVPARVSALVPPFVRGLYSSVGRRCLGLPLYGYNAFRAQEGGDEGTKSTRGGPIAYKSSPRRV